MPPLKAEETRLLFRNIDEPGLASIKTYRKFGGYQKRASVEQKSKYAFTATCACGTACGVHGHAHAWELSAPTGDRAFWGALGCSCWAV